MLPLSLRCARDSIESVSRYVIDPLTLLHLVDNDLDVRRDHQLVAPNSIRSEAMQLLLSAVRSGERTEREALQAHERVTELKMRLLGDRASRGTAWRIAREHDWATLRDTEYLAIVRLQGDALVSMDPDLTARAEGIVPTASVDDLLAP